IICEQANIANHACLKDYIQSITKPDTLYFYINFVFKYFFMPIQGILSEQNSCEKQRNSDKGLKAKLNHDDEETLILEFQLQEPLESNSGPRKKRKKSNSGKSVKAIDKIANVLCNDNDILINLPPIPVPNEINSFLLILGCQLRELALRKRREIIKKVLDIRCFGRICIIFIYYIIYCFFLHYMLFFIYQCY
ncbi:hypothetical protein ALC56_09091, partial [Trachymyrmex septentrionalis]